jgi:protocatechuate 3,4-dioxygenase beta subunit
LQSVARCSAGARARLTTITLGHATTANGATSNGFIATRSRIARTATVNAARRIAQQTKARMINGDEPTPGWTTRRVVAARRATLRLLGGVALAFAGRASAQGNAANAQPPARTACVLTPAQTEGPYFVDQQLDRSDVRSDPVSGAIKPGVPLTLALTVLRFDGGRCTPLPRAIVDIWHCDAAGVYSGAGDRRFDTRGARFLRGFQITDSEGRVHFTTIYPGAYPGRAVHIHFKVRAQAAGRDAEFTSQLYFDDALTDRVHAAAPYTGPAPRVRNEQDGLYRRGGRALTLDVTSADGGYHAAYDVGVRVA